MYSFDTEVDRGLESARQTVGNSLMGMLVTNIFYFFTLSVTVLTHFHLGEYFVSLRRVIGAGVFGFFFILIYTAFTQGGSELWWLYWIVMFAAVGQRIFTKVREKRGWHQYPSAVGYPFLMLFRIPQTLSYYLMMGIFFWVAYLAYAHVSGALGFYLFLCALGYGFTMLFALESQRQERYRMKTEMLKGHEMVVDPNVQKVRESVSGSVKPTRQQPAQVAHRVEDETGALPVQPKGANLSAVKQSYEGLLDKE
jgi:hypothetical protein